MMLLIACFVVSDATVRYSCLKKYILRMRPNVDIKQSMLNDSERNEHRAMIA